MAEINKLTVKFHVSLQEAQTAKLKYIYEKLGGLIFTDFKTWVQSYGNQKSGVLA